MEKAQRTFIPAAGHDWLLPLYDPLNRLIGGDSLKRDLVQQAGIASGSRVLDIGCGTGSVAILAQKLYPQAEITGMDPDPKALDRARRKAARAGVTPRFDQGFSDELPYPDDSFDLVLSSFMFHHLKEAERIGTLKQVMRVLRPGGSLHLVDFGAAQARRDGPLARLLHSAEHVHHNFEGGLEALLRGAGFASVEQLEDRRTLFGALAHYRARA